MKDTKKSRKSVKGNRAFYYTPKYAKPLCLQSRQHNGDMKGLTWVYYSEKDARRLQRFLNEVFTSKKEE